MADHPKIEEIVERVVGQVLESHVPHLREELVRRVLEEMPVALASASENGASSQALLQSLVAIQKGTAQKEILKQLLEQTAGYCGRAALFIVKAGTIQAWQARGFDNDQIRHFTLQGTTDLVKHTLEAREATSGFVAQMGDQFATTFDAPSEADCVLLPLILKEKVAALVYADAGSGPGGVLDLAALEIMVRATGHWLEVLVLRRSPVPAGAAEAPAETALSAVEGVGETTAPEHVRAAAASAQHGALPADGAPPDTVHAPPHGLPVAAAPDPNDIQTKAQRFARLLIDEIKLYNLAKVEEGRRNHDLYERLRDDIEKSRTIYEKRYHNTPAAAGDYFYHELVRSLAQDDPSLLGTNYRR